MLKRILLLTLSFTLIFMLFACGGGGNTCQTHTDKDSDGKCDTCGENVENSENNNNNNNSGDGIALIKSGNINFQFVHSSKVGGGVMMAINTLKMKVESLGSTLDIVTDRADNVQDIEVLIGDVTTRGEKYAYDKYSLGMKGYVIKMVDNKIIINAGSTDTLVDAVEMFIENILGIKDTTSALSDVTMTEKDELLEIQDDYRITSVKIGGEEIKGYTIAYDFGSSKHQTAAASLNKFLYESAGYYLPIVPLYEADKSIIIETVDDAGRDGFRVKADGNKLRIQCAYNNKFEEAFNSFFSTELRIKTGDINFDSSYGYSYEISVVYYDDFLHLSEDGNDYPAIKAAHDFANEGGQTVKATNGKTYRISLLGYTRDDGKFAWGGSIIIKTNVDWGKAEFIIDDTDIGPINEYKDHKTDVFIVESDYRTKSVTLVDDDAKALFPSGAGPQTTKIDWTADYPVMMILYNDNHQDHVRYGGSYSTRGRVQKEIIIVDENGNIDETTKLLYDFTEVTDVIIRRIDDSPITISGGKFTTLASQVPVKVTGNDSELFISRGIYIRRSNTLLKDVKHYVQNELPGTDDTNKGVSYSGFFNCNEANNITIDSCVLTGRKYYFIAGTYDFASTLVNNVTLKNCTQSNFHLENGNNSMQGTEYWGCGTSNYTKNLVYDGTTLSRFDAHASLYRGKIINSTVTSINLIGGGDMLIENSTVEVVSSSIINLRSDYGATWNGTVTIKDTNVVSHNTASQTPREMNIIHMPWANHDFGYPCHMPNLTLDNITYGTSFMHVNIVSASGSKGGDAPTFTITTEQNLHLSQLQNGDTNINPLVPPSFIEIKNNKAKMTYRIYNVPFFDKTTISQSIIKVSVS